MKTMTDTKRLFLALLLMMGCASLWAQQYEELWMAGSAVPGGTQQLQLMADGSFKFAGTLQEGELRIQTQRRAGRATTYLAPQLPDALIANRGLQYQPTTDAQAAAWQVPFTEERYRLSIDTRRHVLHGELVQPWGELFIAGGATQVGWKSEGKMLLMKQDGDNPFIWTWEGELKAHPEVEEPQSFKFQGQDRWHPKSLHPYRADGDILTDRQLRTGGDDTKWTITEEGIYRITIDLLHETVEAKIINKQK